MLRSGLGVFIILVALLYFTGAGSNLWSRVQGIDASCYSGLSRYSPELANPVCNGVARAMAAANRLVDWVSDYIDGWSRNVSDISDGSIGNMTRSVGFSLKGLASSNDRLAQLMRDGPGSLGESTREPFQQAVDSLTIAQSYLRNNVNSGQALGWLQNGAAQPHGYGLLSQLELGNIYANGGNGIAPNPQLANQYLGQAQNSLASLKVNNSPHAQLMLSTLPGSPDQIKVGIEKAMQQLRQR